MFIRPPLWFVYVFVFFLGACVTVESPDDENSSEDPIGDENSSEDPIGDENSSEDPMTAKSGTEGSTTASYADSQGESDGTETDENRTPLAVEPYDIPIGQSIMVGAFVLDVSKVSVTPDEQFGTSSDTSAKSDTHMQIDFIAHNGSTSAATPLVNLRDDALLFEAAGKFYYGKVSADQVPGGRDGQGTLSWVIHDEVTPEDVRNGVITLGYKSQNQVVVPLADPAATISLEEIKLDTRFKIEGYHHVTIEVTSVWVQYNSYSRNVPLDAGTALLIADMVLSADPDMPGSGEVWGDGSFSVMRPDGVSVHPHSFVEAVYPNDRYEEELIFDLTVPVTGTYKFSVGYNELPPDEHEIVIP